MLRCVQVHIHVLWFRRHGCIARVHAHSQPQLGQFLHGLERVDGFTAAHHVREVANKVGAINTDPRVPPVRS